MEGSVQAPAAAKPPAHRPVWLIALAAYSVVLGLITGIPQLYYVLFALHLVTIGPHSNALGQVWFYYILNGQQGGYLQVDPGTLAGGVEDAFMMAPLYVATGVGLWLRRPWVVPVGLITGAMIFYAILYFFFSGLFDSRASTAAIITDVASTVPYLLYPLWLVPTLLSRRARFQPVSVR